MQRLFAAAVVVALALVLVACAEDSVQPVRIVLITVDTLRYDAFTPRGERTDMPLTWALAQRGQVFEHAYAASPQTQPTHASLFTGLHPWEHGVARNGSLLSDEHETVAEILADGGFSTAAVVASFPLERRFGLAQGFRHFEQEFDRDFGLAYWEGELVEARRFYTLAEAITPRALRLLDETSARRQFLWVHYFDAHDPYGDTGGVGLSVQHILKLVRAGDLQGARRVAQAQALYRRDVASLDVEVARLIEAALAESDVFETHVVLTADHGESLGEDGVLGHGYHAPREQIHVPLFILSPRLQRGVRTDPTGSVDVGRTLLSLAGLDRALGHGRDLTRAPPEAPGVIVGMRQPLPQPYPYMGVDGREIPLPRLQFFAVEQGRYYLGTAERATVDGRPLTADDLDLPRTRERFAAWQAALEQATVTPVDDPETLEALRALGYVE